jgi:hypothetical protein
MEAIEKIKNGTIRIENGRLIGLGITGQESIDLKALEELMDATAPEDIAESFNDTIQGIGSLAIHLYKAGESIPDPTGAIISSVPDENNLYHIHLVSKFFSK